MHAWNEVEIGGTLCCQRMLAFLFIMSQRILGVTVHYESSLHPLPNFGNMPKCTFCVMEKTSLVLVCLLAELGIGEDECRNFCQAF